MYMESSALVSTYDAKYLQAFIELNLEWIKKYFAVEDADQKQLFEADELILKKGGEIFFVIKDLEALGTCAMIPFSHDRYELAKMAVSPKAQGRGYGNLLMEAAINWARAKGVKEITLLSNHILGPALNLYRKYGFKEIDEEHPEYKRCDVVMRLKL